MQLYTYAYIHHIFTYCMAYDLGTTSEVGLKRPQTASGGLSRGNLSKNQDFGQKSWILRLFCPQIRVYGIGGRSMASGRPRRSASDDLKRPQVTKNGLNNAQKLGFWLEISFLTTEMDGYWPNSCICRYMASGRPRRSASSGLSVLKWPQYCLKKGKTYVKPVRDEKFGKNGGISQIFEFYCIFIDKYLWILDKKANFLALFSKYFTVV